jgi:hypothetical protein
MNDCPDVQTLLDQEVAARPPHLTEHLAQCEGCAAIVAHQAFRRLPDRPEARPGCDQAEVAIAAFTDGVLDELGERRLAVHLAACARCRDTAIRMAFFGGDLDDVPEPVFPTAARAVQTPPAPAATSAAAARALATSAPAASVPAARAVATSVPAVSVPAAPAAATSAAPAPAVATSAAAAPAAVAARAQRRPMARPFGWAHLAAAALVGAVLTAGVLRAKRVPVVVLEPGATAALGHLQAPDMHERDALDAERARLDAERAELLALQAKLAAQRAELEARAAKLPPPQKPQPAPPNRRAPKRP